MEQYTNPETHIHDRESYRKLQYQVKRREEIKQRRRKTEEEEETLQEDDTRGDGATDTQIRIDTELKLTHIYDRLRYRTQTHM